MRTPHTLREAAERVRRAEAKLAAAREQRRRLVRQAARDGYSLARIGEAIGRHKATVQQLLDEQSLCV